MKEHISPNLKKLAKIIKKKGELYIVGGYVRDTLSDIFSSDIDLASQATLTEVKDLLKNTEYKVKDVSKKMGTCVVSLGEERWEYSTFRKEIYDDIGTHTPVEVKFITSIEEDAKRRDFTINAIYYDILKDKIIDFYNGQEDLKKKLIRCVETPEIVLNNDGLRILRMIRIATERAFKISSDVLVTAYEKRENLDAISPARKFGELYRIIMSQGLTKQAKKCSYLKGLDLINRLKLWPYFGLATSKIKFKMMKKVPYELRFYAFLIDCINVIKPSYQSEFIDNFLGKEGFGMPQRKIENIKSVIRGYYEALAKRNNKKYFLRYFDYFDIIVKLLDKKNKNIAKKYTFFYNYLINNRIPIRIKDLKISGHDIKASYPQVAETNYKYILQLLLERVFDGFVANDKVELIDEIKKII